MVCKLGDLDTWRTSQSTRSSPDKLGTIRRSAICSVSRCGCSFCVNSLSTIGCVRAFSLVTESSLLYDSTESSKLQMWLWFGPTSVDWVEARRLRLGDRFRIVASPQHLAQNLAQVSLWEFDHLLCCLWHPLSPSCRAQAFLVQVTSSQIDCCCCCDCKLFVNATFGAGRGIETLSNNIRDYICHLGDAIPRIDSFLWKSELKMSVLYYLEMDFRFSSPRVPNTFTMWTSMTGPIMVSPGIAAKKKSGLWVCSGELCILGIVGWDLQNRHPRQVWSSVSYQPIPSTRTMPARIPLWIEESRTVTRSPECFPANCFQMLVLETTPKSSLLVNSRSWVFLYSRILLFLVPSLSSLQDRLNADRTTSVIKILFTIVRNSNISHQLRVNWYSSRMTLNCSKISYGFCGILTILNSCLAASFMNKEKPILFWDIPRSMFCKRFQQYWPNRVPMHWAVRLSLILVVWRTILVTILETAIAKSPPSGEWHE